MLVLLLSLVGDSTSCVGGLLTGTDVGVGDNAEHASPTARIDAANANK